MGNEIKINQQPIEKSLADLKTSIDAVETSFTTDFKGENVLEMINKLHEINSSLGDVLTSYQTLLHHNEAATRESVEALVQVDKDLASGYHLLK